VSEEMTILHTEKNKKGLPKIRQATFNQEYFPLMPTVFEQVSYDALGEMKKSTSCGLIWLQK